MSTRTRVEQVPATVKTVEDGRNCDRCGADIPKDRGYERREFVMCFAVGTHYPEGAFVRDGWQVQDCCDGCAELVRAFLESQGFTLTVPECYP